MFTLSDHSNSGKIEVCKSFRRCFENLGHSERRPTSKLRRLAQVHEAITLSNGQIIEMNWFSS